MARKPTSTAKAKNVNHYIREWRKHRKLTQEQLAEMIGQTSGGISQLENGLINYTQPTLEAIADALGSTPALLLGYNPANPDGFLPLLERLEKSEPQLRLQIAQIIEAALKPPVAPR